MEAAAVKRDYRRLKSYKMKRINFAMKEQPKRLREQICIYLKGKP